MELPTDSRTPWPPPEVEPVYSEIALHDAWYSGDPARLAQLYYTQAFNPFSVIAREALEISQDRRYTVHVPIAGDIAATSAALLFSEHPQISCESPDAQERLEQILSDSNAFGTLAEAAELAAALGGVFLKINWDSSLLPCPFISVAQPDRAVPTWRFGRLVEVVFWTEVEDDGRSVWRLLERHVPGAIQTALYQGTSERLGTRRALTTRQDTASIPEVVETGVDELLVRYVPNSLPNRRRRGSPWGQSDYSGSETLMATLDDVFTSLLRDIRLGRGRLLVPAAFLQRDASGERVFDSNAEAFVKLDSIPGSGNLSSEITVQQFEIRTREHLEAAVELVHRIVTHAGYSPQTFGLNVEGQAESGTALRMRERKSLLTAGKKSEYWRPAIVDLCELLLAVDRLHMSGTAPVERPAVAMQDSVIPDLSETARSVEMLQRAQAASVETRVRLLHPDWTDEAVQAEVEAVRQESGLAMPDVAQMGFE